MPLSLPITPTKEHCASGAVCCVPRVLDARKEISMQTINMSNNHRAGKREKISLKPNTQKGQEVKQQHESLTEVSGCGASGSCWPAIPLQIWAVHVLHTMAEEVRNLLKYSHSKRSASTPHLHDPPKEGELNTCISQIGKLRQGAQQHASAVSMKCRLSQRKDKRSKPRGWSHLRTAQIPSGKRTPRPRGREGGCRGPHACSLATAGGVSPHAQGRQDRNPAPKLLLTDACPNPP